MKKLLSSRWGILLAIFTYVAVCKLSGNLEALAALPVMFGTVDSVPGYPNFTSDATGSGKIPQLFSRKAIVKFYDESVLPFISQRDYEGGC